MTKFEERLNKVIPDTMKWTKRYLLDPQKYLSEITFQDLLFILEINKKYVLSDPTYKWDLNNNDIKVNPKLLDNDNSHFVRCITTLFAMPDCCYHRYFTYGFEFMLAGCENPKFVQFKLVYRDEEDSELDIIYINNWQSWNQYEKTIRWGDFSRSRIRTFNIGAARWCKLTEAKSFNKYLNKILGIDFITFLTLYFKQSELVNEYFVNKIKFNEEY